MYDKKQSVWHKFILPNIQTKPDSNTCTILIMNYEFVMNCQLFDWLDYNLLNY